MHSRGAYYRVRKGDTLYSISKKYRVEIQTIVSLNEISAPNNLKTGTLLYIPSAGKKSPYKRKNRPKYARKIPYTSIKPKEVFIWPIKGSILTRFGKEGKHRYDGINIQGNRGADIRASSNGKVVYSGSGVKGYGNMIILKHKNSFYSIYALNSENLVSKGDFVKRSQIIAKVGGIPRVGKSFLHFQLRAGKRALDPIQILR